MFGGGGCNGGVGCLEGGGILEVGYWCGGILGGCGAGLLGSVPLGIFFKGGGFLGRGGFEVVWGGDRLGGWGGGGGVWVAFLPVPWS